MPKFDRYTVFARLFPAVIAMAPAIALAWALVSWHSLSVTHAIAGTALTVLLMVFADVARRRGKQIEPGLIERMGGLPSVTMLRHGDPTFDKPTKERMHAILASKLAETAPTASQEESDSEAANSFYSRAGTWLRENTRDQKKFEIVFNENVTYGYRRNLFALKWPALFLNASIVGGCAVAYWYGLPQKYQVDLVPVFVIAILHALYLAWFSSEGAVSEAARTYARQLLLSTESPHLTTKAPSNPRTKKAAP